jgi:hypothetical protein
MQFFYKFYFSASDHKVCQATTNLLKNNENYHQERQTKKCSENKEEIKDRILYDDTNLIELKMTLLAVDELNFGNVS